MQTWARRGFQAALVTGGMLAVGTGVASGERACPNRPLQSPRLPHARYGMPGYGEFTGELYPEDPWSPDARNPVRPASRSLSGTLDSRSDELPTADQGSGRHRRPPGLLELAGWVADTSKPGIPVRGSAPHSDSGHTVEMGTPAEGFYRSLSWIGAVGEIRHDLADDRVLAADQALVVPSDDPAVVTGFDHADSIVELWEGALGFGAPDRAALLTLGSVDLTRGGLADPASDLHTVPAALVASALSAVSAPAPVPRDFVPLTVPGEYQEQVSEVPNLSNLVDVDWSSVARRGEWGQSDLERTVPGVPAWHHRLPPMSKIIEALEGRPAPPAPAMPDWLSATMPLPTLTHV